MSNEYLNELNDQQRAAVEYLDGPELVIAGAGSGKTRVLTYKIIHLLAHGYEPWRIMALTFTNKAANEMKERIVNQAGAHAASKITMGTFHSVFARMLRANAERIGYKPNYTIYDSADSLNLVKTIIRDMDLDEKVYKPSSIAGLISRCKNALVMPADYINDQAQQNSDRHHKIPRAGEIYAAYCHRCRTAQAMDFDDLLVNTNILLRDNPDVRRHYQDFYRYILVDEYQDTNFAQHAIVRQLTVDGNNVCVVGDDAQSIYSFRGANIGNILGLGRSFPNLRTFKLERNYRSTENIVNAASSLIGHNKNQLEKHVFSKNGPGFPVEVVKSYSDYEESYLVASRICQLKQSQGASYDEFAILYRTNAQSRALEESLRKRNIPYRIYGGKSFYERKEVKDAIAFFRLAINPDDDEALRRVINVPARGIGETTVKKLVSVALRSGISLWDVLADPVGKGVSVNRGTLSKLITFRTLIERFAGLVVQGLDADKAARAIIGETGLISQYMSDTTPENISRMENVEELLNSAAQFVEEGREQGIDDLSLPAFMAQVSLATDIDKTDADTPNECVTLMTIHASKGLEFDNIFVVGVEEDLLPSSMSNDTLQGIEEERRLLYVAITRARRFCMLSFAGSRFRNGMSVMTSPSRFLGELDPSFLKFVTGTNIDQFHNPLRDSYSASTRNQTSAGRYKPSPSPSFGDRRSYGNPPSRNTGRFPTPSTPPSTPPANSAGHIVHEPDELEPGMLIEHNRFGKGTITQIDATNPNGPRISVRFDSDNNIIRTLILRFAKFAIIS